MMHAQRPGRRQLLAGGAVLGALALLPGQLAASPRAGLVARPPAGFVPLSRPGRVVRVSKSNTMQDNGLWPKQEAASVMLERVMTELTGKPNLVEALKLFVHPSDRVAIKPNGIAGRQGATMAANKELLLALVKGIVALGVPPTQIEIFEQYPSFLAGTRVADRARKLDPDFPAGVRVSVHENKEATMEGVSVFGVSTKYVRAFTEASCVINVTQIKDHSICGYTGALKNITHGAITNPHDFHAHLASPQIALLYAQDIVKSRVRLHLTDAFKVIYDQGPLDKNPKRRVVEEAVYATTDPVAMDVVGCKLVEKLRADNSLPTLKDAGREPTYIRVAGELGLGVFDANRISLREIAI